MALSTGNDSHLDILRCLLLALHQKPASEKKRNLRLVQEIREAEDRSEYTEPIIKLVSSKDWEQAEKELEACRAQSVEVVSLFDAGYPPSLNEIIDPPLVLYVRGKLPTVPGLAIVGSRKATQYGTTFAYTLARKLSSHGIPIISGLARGIDTTAHRGSVDGGASGLAVLGSGVMRIYPSENEALAESLLSTGGAIMSEYGLFTSPRDYFFPERNRLVAAMSKAVVVVEAEKRSGALITARLAAEQGRDVFSLPGSILSPLSEGTNWLIKCGAAPMTGFEDLFGIWPELAQLPERQQPAKAGSVESEPLAPGVAQVLELLDFQVPKPFDALVEALSLPAGELAHALSILELEGRISRLPGAHFLKNQTVDMG